MLNCFEKTKKNISYRKKMISQKTFDTPILFLIFNRPDTSIQVFEQIKKIKPKYLFVAADGAREHVEGEKQKCELTRDIIKNVDWDCEIKTLFREENWGCGPAVSGAISWFFDQVEYGIILEDDCLPSLTFFTYCQELLVKYKEDPQVMLIGGNNFQNGIIRGKGSYYFSQYPHIWGWASWRRAWQYYEYDIQGLDAFLKTGISTIFKTATEKKYWEKVFLKVSQGKANTWDYQWVYAIWKNKGYSISPNVNLVVNLGFRNSSTHTFLRDSRRDNLKCEDIVFPMQHPPKKIEFEADLITFKNVYGKSLKRMIRLVRENNFIFLIKYYFKI